MPDAPNWKDSLPEELKAHKGLTDVKDVGSLAQQFIDGQSMIGQSIRVPGPDAGEEAWTAFHSKLTDKVPNLIPTPDKDNEEQMNALFTKMGRPETAVGYEHPDGVDATQMAEFAQLAHGLGLTGKQYTSMVGSLAKFTETQKEAATEAFQIAERALKQEWGIVYEDNLQLVDSVMKGTGAPAEMLELAANKQLSPETTKWLYEIGQQLGSEGINFDKNSQTTRLAPQEAKDRAAEMMADTSGPYWDASHPDHQAYKVRYVDLLRAAAAGGL